MNKDQRQSLKGIMNRIEGVDLHEKHGGSFKFKMHVTQSMSDTPLEALDLGVRSYNSLKRAGYNTIGDVLNTFSSGAELRKIRNCGKTSSREIMERLFIFQYECLPAGRRDQWLKEVVELNMHNDMVRLEGRQE